MAAVSFKAVKSNQLVLSDRNPYVLNAVDDTKLPIVVDTGACDTENC
jgi:hypothetical protein